MTDSSKVAATVVHEQTRHRFAQEGQTETLSRDDQTTLATNHGDRAAEIWTAYSGLAGISTQSNTSQSSWNAANRNSSVVQAGTNHIAGIKNNELKARQLNNKELDYINFTASSDYAAKKGITPEQAKKELMRGAALGADTDWEKAYETYTEEEVDAYKAANEYLAKAAEQEGLTFTNEKGQEQAAYTSTEEQRNNHDLNLSESLGDDSYIANVGIADDEKNWIQKNSEINKKILKGAIGFSNGISNSVVDTYNTVKALASTDKDQLKSMGKGLKSATDAFNNDPELAISTIINESVEPVTKGVDKVVQLGNKITLLEAQGRGDEAVELEAEIVGGQVDPTAKILNGIAIISKAGNKLNKTVKVVEKQTDNPKTGMGETSGVGSGAPVNQLEVGKVETYKNSKKITGDGSIHRDHQPSKAALIRRAEELKGEPLTPAEIKRIENNANTVTVPIDVHKAGPTYGGKNTRALQEADAKNLQRAASRDADAMVDNAKDLSAENVPALQNACNNIKCITNDQYDDFLRKQLDE